MKVGKISPLIILAIILVSAAPAQLQVRFDCGDVNIDGTTNIFDINYLVSYLYLDGPTPSQPQLADVDSSGIVNIFDITYLITYLYLNGPAPSCPSQPEEPSGELAGHSGCLYGSAKDTLDEDCITYAYDNGTLYLTHLNDLFNCCPDSFIIDINIDTDSNIIGFIETEELGQSGGCDCLCLYNLDYELVNIPPGVYTIRVDNPYYYYWYGYSEIIEFTADFIAQPTGYFCVDRMYLPWMDGKVLRIDSEWMEPRK
jgi:hypothetical protein